MSLEKVLKEWYESLEIEKRKELVANEFEKFWGMTPSVVKNNDGQVTASRKIKFEDLSEDLQKIVAEIAWDYTSNTDKVLSHITMITKEYYLKEGTVEDDSYNAEDLYIIERRFGQDDITHVIRIVCKYTF